MSWWAGIGIGVLAGWCVFQLWRAATLGRIRYRYGDLERGSAPVSFWLSVAFHAAFALFFGGGLILLALDQLIHPLS